MRPAKAHFRAGTAVGRSKDAFAEHESESIEKFISKIVRNLEGLGENEIPTSTIGKFIMKDLANLDQVAYVRFASVYKNFKEAKDFEQFIGNLNVYKSE